MQVLLGQQDATALRASAPGSCSPSARRSSAPRLPTVRRAAPAYGLPISVRATVSICCSPPLIRPPGRLRHLAEIREQAEQLFWRPAAVHRRAAAGGRPRDFPSTVRSAKTRRSSGTKPMPSRAIRYGGNFAMSCPRKLIAPRRDGNMPISAFIVVDLPAPLRPISATTSPRPDFELDVEQDLRAAVEGVRDRRL